MKLLTTPLRLLTLPAWLAPRTAQDRRDPDLDTPPPPAAAFCQAPAQPAPLSRDEIERALDAGLARGFAPRRDAEVLEESR